MGKNRVSVFFIMSVYKNDDIALFKEAYQSLIDQEINHSEIQLNILIGVDGKVSEEFNQILKEINDNNNSCKVFFFEQNRGLASVLNDLIKYAIKNSADYLVRMDADDISVSSRIKDQVQFLEGRPNLDIAGGAYLNINHKGELDNKIKKFPESHEECKKSFVKQNPLAHPTVIIRPSFFEKAGYYPEDYKKDQDYALWLNGFANGCQFGNFQEMVLYYRVTADMLKSRRGGYDRAKKVLKLRLNAVKTLNLNFKSVIFAYLIFLITISPYPIKKMAYKIFR
jgi:glycosyltransferase involved in cell wall biosynthesis